MYLASTFSQSRELVLNTYTGTLMTASLCLKVFVHPQACGLSEVFHIFWGWANVSCGSIGKARSECRIGYSWKRESGWRKQGFYQGDGSTLVKRAGLIFGLCQPNSLPRRYSRCIQYNSFEIFTMIKRYTTSAGTWILCHSLPSGAQFSTECIWKQSWYLKRRLKNRRGNSRRLFIRILRCLVECSKHWKRGHSRVLRWAFGLCKPVQRT